MPYAMFHQYFPDIAESETRSVTILHDSDWGLPAGDYGFLEMFCDEPGCDCRRVFLCVFAERTKKAEAYIAYGWESRAYYRSWLRRDDPQTIRELQGPMLNPGSPQSSLAPALLRLFQELLLKDIEYFERIKRHYCIFRERIDGSHNVPMLLGNPKRKRKKS
jgi:hypothetical protein